MIESEWHNAPLSSKSFKFIKIERIKSADTLYYIVILA